MCVVFWLSFFSLVVLSLGYIFFEFCLNLVYEFRYPVRRLVCICPTVPAVPVAALLGNEGCSASCATIYLFSFASLGARVSWHALRCDFVFLNVLLMW